MRAHEKIEFKAVHINDDNWGIRIYINEQPMSAWVKWVDLPDGSVARVNLPEYAWRSSKSQAHQGAKELNEYYASGVIK